MPVPGEENVYPIEVETVLSKHPAVWEVAVFGLPDERWGEVVVAAVTLQRGGEDDAGALLAHGRNHLASYKVPKRIEVISGELPKTGPGKVAKRVLREQLLP